MMKAETVIDGAESPTDTKDPKDYFSTLQLFCFYKVVTLLIILKLEKFFLCFSPSILITSPNTRFLLPLKRFWKSLSEESQLQFTFFSKHLCLVRRLQGSDRFFKT